MTKKSKNVYVHIIDRAMEILKTHGWFGSRPCVYVDGTDPTEGKVCLGLALDVALSEGIPSNFFEERRKRRDVLLEVFCRLSKTRVQPADMPPRFVATIAKWNDARDREYVDVLALLRRMKMSLAHRKGDGA